MQRQLEQPRVGFLVGAERTMRAMPSFLAWRRRLANCELSRLSTAAPPGSTPRRSPPWRRRSPRCRAEEFEMHRLDRGDDRDMRPHHPTSGVDLAGVVHADLEDRKARVVAGQRASDSGTPQ
jgi:hypothetical protein